MADPAALPFSDFTDRFRADLRRRPIFYIGGGVIRGRATDPMRRLVEVTGIPLVTTLMARGAFPDDHELCLGMPGMHGNYTAVMSMQESDLLIALGSRFDIREFHDAVLGQGSVPLDALDAQINAWIAVRKQAA